MAKKKQKHPLLHKLLIALVIILALLIAILLTKATKEKQREVLLTYQQQGTIFDFGNQSIMLNNQELSFKNGLYENSDQTYTARITNQKANPSGSRAAAILIDNPGGSGTFYYLVGAISKDGKITYSEPVLLGDRIQIVSLTVDEPERYDNGVITVTYLNRPDSVPFSEEPTQQKIVRYAFEENGNLLEILN